MKKSFLVLTASMVLGIASYSFAGYRGFEVSPQDNCPVPSPTEFSPTQRLQKSYDKENYDVNPLVIFISGLKRSTSSSSELYDLYYTQHCIIPDVGPETPPASPSKSATK